MKPFAIQFPDNETGMWIDLDAIIAIDIAPTHYMKHHPYPEAMKESIARVIAAEYSSEPKFSRSFNVHTIGKTPLKVEYAGTYVDEESLIAATDVILRVHADLLAAWKAK